MLAQAYIQLITILLTITITILLSYHHYWPYLTIFNHWDSTFFQTTKFWCLDTSAGPRIDGSTITSLDSQEDGKIYRNHYSFPHKEFPGSSSKFPPAIRFSFDRDQVAVLLLLSTAASAGATFVWDRDVALTCRRGRNRWSSMDFFRANLLSGYLT